MNVCLLDTENGSGSVADLITGGTVTRYDASTFEKAEQIYWALYLKQIQADVIVVDTLGTLVDSYVRDCTLDPKDVNPTAGKTWWSMRGKMRQSQDTWNLVNYGMGAFIAGIRNLPQPSVFNVHETERDDPTADVETDRHMPALTPRILKQVLALSDLVMRIYRTVGPTTINGVQYPPNTRVLQLENTGSAYTGVRLVPSTTAALPTYIAEPTLLKLAQAIGHLPKAMTVYGFPKTGKTVFSCTMPA